MAEKEIHTRIPFCDLQIDRQEIYRAMGYREEVPEIQFREMVETMLEELAGPCRPHRGGTNLLSGGKNHCPLFR